MFQTQTNMSNTSAKDEVITDFEEKNKGEMDKIWKDNRKDKLNQRGQIKSKFMLEAIKCIINTDTKGIISFRNFLKI